MDLCPEAAPVDAQECFGLGTKQLPKFCNNTVKLCYTVKQSLCFCVPKICCYCPHHFCSFAVKNLEFINPSALLTVAIIPLFCPSPLIHLIGLHKKRTDDD